MSKKMMYIVGIMLVLLIGLFSFRLYASTNEQEIENTITEFFNAFYTVTPDTLDLIIPSSAGVDGVNQGVVDYENYAKSTFNGLYTEKFYESFLVGDRYMIMAPQIAKDNEITISFKSIELTPIESSDNDKYYDFTVEFVVKDNVSGTEEILINKGQVRVKQEYFKYKIHAIKFFDDKLVKYLK
jgi:hypothetical protein